MQRPNDMLKYSENFRIPAAIFKIYTFKRCSTNDKNRRKCDKGTPVRCRQILPAITSACSLISFLKCSGASTSTSHPCERISCAKSYVGER